MKKIFKFLKTVFVILILFFVFSKAHSQITVNNYTAYNAASNSIVANALVDTLLGTSVDFSNAAFYGVRDANGSYGYQICYFTTETTTESTMQISRGIALTSGNSNLISLGMATNPGQSNSFSKGYNSSTPGELRKSTAGMNDMNILAGAVNWFNGAVLEFDFTPTGDSVVFRYVFGGEEYSDNTNFTNYQCSAFNDKFGFLISGPGISGGDSYDNDAKNIARLNNGSEVGINSVNNGTVGSSGTPNGAYICEGANDDWVQGTPSPEFLGTIPGTALNGNTIPLYAAQGGLTPGATYHIKLLICDATDGAYDAIVYLEAGSFISPSPTLTLNANPSTLCDGESTWVVATTTDLVTPITYEWSNGETHTTNNPTDSIQVSPSLTTTYNITVTDGMMATYNDSFEITVSPLTTPAFNAVGPYCSGDLIPNLLTTSTNGTTGTWSPAIDNTQTVLYTFTPNAGQCSNNTTLSITVNPTIIPTFDAVGPYCNGDIISSLPTTSNNGVDGTWSPAINNTNTTLYTFTPAVGECATSQTLTIDITQPTLPTFDAVDPYCTGDIISALPTTSNNGIDGAWSPAIDNMATTIYTFTPTAGQCATSTTLTIIVNSPGTVPTFDAVGPYCNGDAISALPITSNNGIIGSWSPAIDNTATTIYTFTPNIGQCATSSTLTITVNNLINPSFDALGPFCSGATISDLPLTSNNGVSGTWSPVIDNTQTTEYTFTPDGSICAIPNTLTITIVDNILPLFDAYGPYCSGEAISDLPINSNNMISGTWSPAIDNTQTTEYTFTPDGGQCAIPTNLTITINPIITAAFDQVDPYCANASIPALNLVSTNGITGTWTPVIDNTNTTTYTFTPAPNQCAAGTSMEIIINPNITPLFDAVNPYCSGATIPALPLSSSNVINGSWSPAINNTSTTTYTFNPTSGQCATTQTLEIVINPIQIPTLASFGPYCTNDITDLLPAISLNSLNGVWNPSEISTDAAGETDYIFTPTGLQCFSANLITVIVYDYPEVDIMVTDTILFSGQETSIIVSGADTYDWFSTNFTICENCSVAIFSAPATQAEDQTFTLILTSSSNSCAVTDTIRITVLGDLEIEIPEGFSPNADENGDTWVIKGLERFASSEVVIHNRWGNKVYSASPYNNDWTGVANNGEKLPAGTYYYVFKPDTEGADVYSGYVYINY